MFSLTTVTNEQESHTFIPPRLSMPKPCEWKRNFMSSNPPDASANSGLSRLSPSVSPPIPHFSDDCRLLDDLASSVLGLDLLEMSVKRVLVIAGSDSSGGA